MSGAATCIRVARAGVLTLLVDPGRAGLGRWGVPPGGPADTEMYALALRLCGAPAGATALEVTAAGPVLELRGAACRLSVAAAGLVEAVVERRAGAREVLRPPRSVTLRDGDRLEVGAVRHTLRAYVGIGGELDLPPQLGSRCVCLRGATSGLLARGLRAGDELRVLAPEPAGPDLELDPVPGWVTEPGPLRAAAGPQWERLSAAGRAALTPGAVHRAGTAVDRAGVRLEGAPLPVDGTADVAVQGCPAGAVQVTGDGTTILLGVDRGTTGGYAIPAVVAAVDLARLGRLGPGSEVCFRQIEVETAEALWQDRRRLLARLGELLRPAA